ncbi:MAG: hypothetical protein AVDCRST_MAG19-3871 [uncultured Thermomicrobiales bacterium]|uniref:Uncharacterized protein n=1 Tax=uncultured Thermomicrobiales bacterium TaxID=1645740 RepID=A0A6J4VIG8_9BACT|nr:MAG: hypothetical protein AVDCRST_MAG19-3871 [uncultured Thermomicrobiales bacterium]
MYGGGIRPALGRGRPARVGTVAPNRYPFVMPFAGDGKATVAHGVSRRDRGRGRIGSLGAC